MTSDLHRKIEARLGELEALAKAANQAYPYSPTAVPPETGVRWRWVAGEQWETVDLDEQDEFVTEPGHRCWLATVEEWPMDRGRMMPRTYMESAVEVDIHAARHIAANDPSTVLAGIAEDRDILRRHAPTPGQHPDFCGYDMHELPCPEVLSLARRLRVEEE